MLSSDAFALATHKGTSAVTVYAALTVPSTAAEGPDQLILRAARVSVPLTRFATVRSHPSRHAY